ncbi:MAG: ammonium transporter [Gemmatimonadales bacterium]
MSAPLAVQAAAAGAAAVSAGDTAWLLVSAALVMLMVPGLALFYGGLVRSRSALNTVMMSVAALGIVGVQWVLGGYSLAFAPGSPVIGRLIWWGLRGVGAEPNATYAATVPHLAFAIYQAMFAAITVALISGAIVERMRFGAYLVFGLLWTTLIYDPLAHWVWADGGWLRTLGALDFAGGTVVHISAGTSALVAAIVLGRRRDLGRQPLVPHNVPFTLLGAGLLWFGWFGFNGGSALASGALAVSAFAATHVAAAAALTTWMALDLLRTRRSTAVGAATGAIVGLVAITPAAGFVTPRGALLIGGLAACASYGAILVRPRTRVDDSLDVFACHGVAGVMGALLTGVFATRAVNPAGADGLLHGNPHQLVVQLIAVVATIVLCAGGTAILLALVGAVMPLRLSVSQEIEGVDLSEHGEEAYYGGDVGALAGRRISIGDSVFLSAEDAGKATRSRR